jgi:ATP-binding cassette subfamily C protein
MDPEVSSPGSRSMGLFLATMFRRLPGKVAVALMLMVGLGLMEGAGLLLLIPLLQLVGLDVQQGAAGRIHQFLQTVFIGFGLRPTLLTVLAAYVGLTAVQALLRRWHTVRSLALNQEMVVLLRQRLYAAMARADWQFFTRARLSDFTHLLTTEVERVGAAAYHILHLAAALILTLVYIALALRIAPGMTVLAFLAGGLLILLVRRRDVLAREAGENTSRSMSELHAAVAEHVGGMKPAKSYNKQEHHVRQFTELTRRVHQSYVQAIKHQAGSKFGFDVGAVILLSVMVYVSVKLFALTTAELLLLIFLFARIMPRFSQIQQGYQSFVNFLPSFGRVMEMQTRCESASESLYPATKALPLRDAVQLKGVHFCYGDRPVIRGLEMIIPAGKTTALVGPSGAGKSTVADLVLGLLQPDRGQVLIDGTPLDSKNLASWRQGIGYVPQETFLFHDSIGANLQWAAPQATEQEIRAALRMAAADDFVGRLPQGLDTQVGDRGVRLSSGERQRLALARALLRRPSLLILDEATSDLDSENESRVMQAIQGLHGRLTILLISHRLSTVRHADRIYVLEDGKLVESETWDGLMTLPGGRFRSFCLAQWVEK